MKKINWGIVGLGNIANTFANAFNIVTNSKLLAVCLLYTSDAADE